MTMIKTEEKESIELKISRVKSFTSKTLIIWLGNQLKHVSYSKLTKLGLIKKTADGYQADITLGGAFK